MHSPALEDPGYTRLKDNLLEDDQFFGDDPKADTLSAVSDFKRRNKRVLLDKRAILAGDACIVLSWVGRFDIGQKGFWMVIDKAADILRYDPLVRLMMFGMLPRVAPNLEEKINSQLSDLVFEFPKRIFVGAFGRKPYSQDEIAQALAGSDFLLMPSVYEPFGLVHLEAMSMGCVPIVHPVGGVKSTIEDPKWGIKPDCFSVGQTAIAMERYASNEYEMSVTESVTTGNRPLERKDAHIIDAHRKFETAVMRAITISGDERAKIASRCMRAIHRHHNWTAIVNAYYNRAWKRLHRSLSEHSDR
jgi:glycosyltransferase involved in cell wall biosynthesis